MTNFIGYFSNPLASVIIVDKRRIRDYTNKVHLKMRYNILQIITTSTLIVDTITKVLQYAVQGRRRIVECFSRV